MGLERRLFELREIINHHNNLYYNMNNPEITDSEYDELVLELIKLEEQFPDIDKTDSPINKVGSKILDAFQSFAHSLPMLSLDNGFKDRDIREFHDRCQKKITDEILTYIAEPKIDGLAIELIYKNNILVRAITRGDGETGEDVTENCKVIKTIPKKLNTTEKIDILEVRGEIFMFKKDFEELNLERGKNNVQLFSNPRNAASGSLKQLDVNETKKRKLSFYAHGVGLSSKTFKSQLEMLDFFKEINIPVSSITSKELKFSEITDFYNHLSEIRHDLTFDIDGVVIKVNDFEKQKFLGIKTKSPRWAIAWKFPATQKTTTIKSIDYQVGKSGAITPVAYLNPVEINGVTITKCTLHNFDEVERKDIRNRDTVVVERAGDVIPKISCVLLEKRKIGSKKIHPPKNCPVCDSLVTKDPDDAIIRCDNPKCAAQNFAKIIHFVSKEGLDIEGLAEGVIKSLLDAHIIEERKDLFVMPAALIKELRGFGSKSVSKLMLAIENAKVTTLDKFLNSLAIRHVGLSTAKILANNFSLDDLMNLDKIDPLLKLDGIGPISAKEIFNYFQNENNKEELNFFKKIFTFIEKEKTIGFNNKLLGKVFVFTGTLKSLTRNQAKEYVEKLGGRVSGSVSKNTSYLVVGENPGNKSKIQDINIINENEFKKIIEI